MPVRRSRGSRKKQNQVSGGAPPSKKQHSIPKRKSNTPVLANHFPTVTFQMDPGTKYHIEPSRKLFGEQRYGLAKTEPKAGVVNRKFDYATKEKAETALNTLNLYAEVWKSFEAGEIERIREMHLIITGDKPEELAGYSDRSLLGKVLSSNPDDVYRAYNKTENKTYKKPKKTNPKSRKSYEVRRF